MANVEIHYPMVALRGAEQTQRTVISVLREAGLDGVITDIIESDPKDVDGNDAPFIRIYAMDQAEIRQIIGALQRAKLGVRTQTVLLGGDHRADLMR
ncbi:MAG: hypothetical protein V1846_02090 [Candidatus Komeilibacteria bacterium]